MPPSRLRFALAQLGRKPGSSDVRARLLSPADLPGAGWRVLDDRTWRTGSQRPAAEWSKRAAAVGSVTAWRSFLAAERSLWVQITPLASPGDAALALASVPERLLSNTAATVQVNAQREVEQPPLIGADACWALQQETVGAGGAGSSSTLAWAAGTWLTILCVGGVPQWSWGELAPVAELLTTRLS